VVVEPPSEHEQVARDRLADGPVVNARAIRQDDAAFREVVERKSVDPGLNRVDPLQVEERLPVLEGDGRVAGRDPVVGDDLDLDGEIGEGRRELPGGKTSSTDSWMPRLSTDDSSWVRIRTATNESRLNLWSISIRKLTALAGFLTQILPFHIDILPVVTSRYATTN